MKNRSKMDKHWGKVDSDVNIFVVHGPPKGILDISEKYDRSLERCGCNALKNHIVNRIQPDLCLFGHIHNVKDIINAGQMQLPGLDTIFSNGSVVTDNRFGKLSSNGNIFTLSKPEVLTEETLKELTEPKTCPICDTLYFNGSKCNGCGYPEQ